MEYPSFTYDKQELAWVTPELTLHRDIYLMVTLLHPGKLVIRQRLADGSMSRVPVHRHKDMHRFLLRIVIIPEVTHLQVFTSTKPKEIKYAYI